MLAIWPLLLTFLVVSLAAVGIDMYQKANGNFIKDTTYNVVIIMFGILAVISFIALVWGVIEVLLH